MRALIFAILIPVLILGALRAELTPWRLLTGKEHADLQARIAALEKEVADGRKVVEEARKGVQVQKEEAASGAWMREAGRRTPLDKGAQPGTLLPGKPK
jgi:hypothetical protein